MNVNGYDGDDDDNDHIQKEDLNNCEGFLNNNAFYVKSKRSCGRGVPANFSIADLQTQEKMIHDAKNKFIYNDLKKVHGVNERFIAESEITELLRNCNIYSAAKSHLNSKNTLKVPNLTPCNLKSKVPIITDDNFFKFDDALPTVSDGFETAYLEAKYKCESSNSSSSSSTSLESPNSSPCSNSSSSSSLSSSSSSVAASPKIELQEQKVLTAKDVYLMKRSNKRGTPILSTPTHFIL